MKIPWKWLVPIVLIVFAVSLLAFGQGGLKMAKDWLLSDQQAIQTDLENEVTKLNKERDTYLSQIFQLRQERARLSNEYQSLKTKYDQLEAQRASIVVPTTADDLANAFRQRGYKSATPLRP